MIQELTDQRLYAPFFFLLSIYTVSLFSGINQQAIPQWNYAGVYPETKIFRFRHDSLFEATNYIKAFRQDIEHKRRVPQGFSISFQIHGRV